MSENEQFIGIGKSVLSFNVNKKSPPAKLYPIRLHYIFTVKGGRLEARNVESGVNITFRRDELRSLCPSGDAGAVIARISPEIAELTCSTIVFALNTAIRYMSVSESELLHNYRKVNPAAKSFRIKDGLKTPRGSGSPYKIVGVEDISGRSRSYMHSGMKVLVLVNALSAFIS